MSEEYGFRDAIADYGFAACIELTNSITRERFEDKISLVRDGKAKLERLMPSAEFIAGIAFLNTSIRIKPTDKNLEDITFIQSLQYDSEMLETAYAQLKDYLTNRAERRAYNKIQSCWQNDVNLELLLNPNPENWKLLMEERDLLKPYRFPTNRRSYEKLVQHIKGKVLELYGRLFYQRALPGAYTEIRVKQQRLDIDLVVVGDKKKIIKAIHNMGVLWLDHKTKGRRRSKNYINRSGRSAKV